jgi:hypothetical protein
MGNLLLNVMFMAFRVYVGVGFMDNLVTVVALPD